MSDSARVCFQAAFICVLSLLTESGSVGLVAQDTVVEVEGQPLAANLQRVVAALDDFGSPMFGDDEAKLNELLKGQKSDALQKLVDKHVLLHVTINPEERVSVTRGTAKAELQQNEYAAFLVKIANHSRATPKLNVTSPQAGAVYAGSAIFSLNRQQQPELGENQNEEKRTDRFLDLEMYRKQPMTGSLSGLEVEYAILLVYSNESGRREATISFDIGEGTKDLGFRHQLPILFDIAPAIPLTFEITDPTQPQTTNAIAQIEIRDRSGRVHPSQPKRLAPDFFFQPQIYRRSGEMVELAAGTYSVRYSRGPEYHLREKKFTVAGGGVKNVLSLELDRWVRPSDYGFYSGDHHIHAAGCAHYTSPTEGMTPEQMYRQVTGEGLNVGCILTWGYCFEYQRQFFKPDAIDFGSSETILKYDLEISGFGSESIGHVCLLNLKNQTYPDSAGTMEKGWPSWPTRVMRWAKEQGGYTGYAHSASGLAIDPAEATNRLIERLDADEDGQLSKDEIGSALLPFDFDDIEAQRDGLLTRIELIAAHKKAATELPNHAIPEMNGVGAMEICVSAVEGVCDFISAMDTARVQEWNTWYHLLNCGFPIKVSGETDFPCMSSRRVGKGRVYVHMGDLHDVNDPIDFATWCRGLAEGKSYVSDGLAHALKFSVGEVTSGHGDVKIDKSGPVTVKASVSFSPRTPRAVAQGTLETFADRTRVGDTVELHTERSKDPFAEWVDGGERTVEIVVNGLPIASQIVPADGKPHDLEFKINVSRSSWVALRQFPQLHTNPVNVIVDGKPIRASRKSAQWCIDMTRLVWKNRHRSIKAEERDEAAQAYDRAISRFEEIAKESP